MIGLTLGDHRFGVIVEMEARLTASVNNSSIYCFCSVDAGVIDDQWRTFDA